MKRITLISILVLLSAASFAQVENSKYDKVLAESLGGDDYGMKMYVFVILKTGQVKIDEKKTVDSLFKGHMDNMGKMVDAGKLVVAGPMKKNEKAYRGIFILNVKTKEEALALLKNDPAVSSGLL